MSAAKKVSQPVISDPFHKPFTWLPQQFENDPLAQLYALTKDISEGIVTCLELVESSEMDRCNDERPILGHGDTSALFRLALASSRMLAHHAEFWIVDAESNSAKKALMERK